MKKSVCLSKPKTDRFQFSPNNFSSAQIISVRCVTWPKRTCAKAHITQDENYTSTKKGHVQKPRKNLPSTKDTTQKITSKPRQLPWPSSSARKVLTCCTAPPTNSNHSLPSITYSSEDPDREDPQNHGRERRRTTGQEERDVNSSRKLTSTCRSAALQGMLPIPSTPWSQKKSLIKTKGWNLSNILVYNPKISALEYLH
jgi:hypothetical protein